MSKVIPPLEKNQKLLGKANFEKRIPGFRNQLKKYKKDYENLKDQCNNSIGNIDGELHTLQENGNKLVKDMENDSLLNKAKIIAVVNSVVRNKPVKNSQKTQKEESKVNGGKKKGT